MFNSKDEVKKLFTGDPNNIEDFNKYLSEMSTPGVWGDGIVLAAAFHLYNRPIHVIETNGSRISIEGDNSQSLHAPIF